MVSHFFTTVVSDFIVEKVQLQEVFNLPQCQAVTLLNASRNVMLCFSGEEKDRIGISVLCRKKRSRILSFAWFQFHFWFVITRHRFVAVRKRKPRTQPLVHKEPQSDRSVNSEQKNAPQMVIPCVQPERPATTNVESFISVRASYGMFPVKIL